jgi:hypothetical protein
MAHDYVERYLTCLPPNLRPDGLTEKLLEPLRDAWRNKWEPEDIARAVLAADYSKAASPAGLAIFRLTQISKQPAPRKNEPTRYEPIERREPTDPDYAARRRTLIKRIIEERISGEEAERLMSQLNEIE